MKVMREDAGDAAALLVLLASYAIGWYGWGLAHLDCYAPGFTGHLRWDMSIACVRVP